MITRLRWLSLPFLLVPCAHGQDERLTYEDLSKQIVWVSAQPSVRWATAGHLILTEGKETVWLDPKTLATSKPPEGTPAEPPAERGPTPGGRRRGGDAPTTENPKPRLQAREGGVWVLPGGGTGEAKLLRAAASPANKIEQLHWSPDGKWISFVRSGNLVVIDELGAGEWAVTSDGGADVFYGVLDWVYQEEVYGRGNYQGHWWSPGSDLVAFLALDQTKVKRFTVVNHVPNDFLDKERNVETDVQPYPKAGDPNPTARFGVARPADKKVTWVDLSSFPKDVLVVRASWTPDGKTLLLTLQDRIQSWAELCAVEPQSGAVTRWIREESKSWVNRPDAPRWLKDGSFLWTSERTGYQHLYRYDQAGKLVNAVTAGEWQLRNLDRVDEQQGLVWFEGSEGGATNRNYYRIGLDGKGLVRLTKDAGSHTLAWNPDRTFFIDTWSALDRPPSVRLCRGDDGTVLKELGQAGKGAAGKYLFSEKQRLSIPCKDGYQLDASLMLPSDRKTALCPIYVPTYSGPDSASVRDTWSHSTWHQYLCQQGFAVLQVNVRSASNRGQVHTAACYQRLGEQELSDLEDAVRHVAAAHHGDLNKVAIAGSSYGGFMAAYALTHGSVFKLGIASAGVYDWRLYDTIYTERYMRTPQENQAGYDATSVIKAAKNLHGHLVLLHGTMDDNVHMQNVMQLLWALQTAGKSDFELMLYPRSKHGVDPRLRWHSQHMEWQALRKLRDGNQGPG